MRTVDSVNKGGGTDSGDGPVEDFKRAYTVEKSIPTQDSTVSYHYQEVAAVAGSVPVQLLRGSLAGTIAKTVVYPFDRLKMIYQVRL